MEETKKSGQKKQHRPCYSMRGIRSRRDFHSCRVICNLLRPLAYAASGSHIKKERQKPKTSARMTWTYSERITRNMS